jgi:signal transduction histidine kinase/CheY-like chemotaxis protein
MKIRKFYSGLFLIVFIVALIITTFMIFFSGIVQDNLKSISVASRIQRKTFQLNDLISAVDDSDSGKNMIQESRQLSTTLADQISEINRQHLNEKEASYLEEASFFIQKIQNLFNQVEKNQYDGVLISHIKEAVQLLSKNTYDFVDLLDYRLQNMVFRVKSIAIGLIILLVALLIFLSHFVKKRISNLLYLIHQGIKYYHDGNFEYRINYPGKDEMGDLVFALDKMSENLKRITVKKEKLEAELKVNEELNKLLETQKDKIHGMLKQSIQANNSKDIFLTNMSHEMRTPLSGIIGTLELLEEQELTEDSNYLVTLSKESAIHLSRIIDDLLEVSKLYNGKYELNARYCNPADIFEESYNLYKITALHKKIDYKIHYDLPNLIFIDSYRLLQILNNLISNAVKFTNQGFIEVTGGFERQNETEGELIIRVKDSGIGIEEEIRDYIFDFFYQKDMSFTKDYQGTGIGLALVKNIVSKMNGKLDAVYDNDVGTEFIIKIPVQYREEHKKDISEESEKKSVEIKRILIVEDNLINRMIMRRLLEKEGFEEIEEAENGRVALDHCIHSDSPYDVIFMDIQMPVMDGLTAMKKIRELNDYETCRIVALTGYKSEEDRQNLINSGFDRYISKPYHQKILSDYIASLKHHE